MNAIGHESSAALSALLDGHRLTVAGSLVDQVRTVDELMTTSGLPRAVVLQALGVLRQVELVEQTGDGYTLPVGRLRALAAAVSDESTPMDAVIGYGMTDDERKVLDRFFSGTTLTQIPTDRPKRLIVLERIALEFDLGRRYDEAEVDEVLHTFHLDVAALRRHLVDERLLSRTRDDGVTRYLRSGGRTTTDS
jgi:hypothetical protein